MNMLFSKNHFLRNLENVCPIGVGHTFFPFWKFESRGGYIYIDFEHLKISLLFFSGVVRLLAQNFFCRGISTKSNDLKEDSDDPNSN